ncbi:hypothetical protein BaRGS_00005624 [Batillaria attramentaria]|uniref:Uncharacterized protein n=1 Tax=Batillaria attramentaria TaxID=370345 RepID=A0ABD0LV51_9CAEN
MKHGLGEALGFLPSERSKNFSLVTMQDTGVIVRQSTLTTRASQSRQYTAVCGPRCMDTGTSLLSQCSSYSQEPRRLWIMIFATLGAYNPALTVPATVYQFPVRLNCQASS